VGQPTKSHELPPERLVPRQESSFLTDQAFFDSLRRYPKTPSHEQEAGKVEKVNGQPVDAYFSGNTHTSWDRYKQGHLETGVRVRLGIHPARDGTDWEVDQLHHQWTSDKSQLNQKRWQKSQN